MSNENPEVKPNGIPIEPNVVKFFFADLVLKQSLNMLKEKEKGWVINGKSIKLQSVSREGISTLISKQRAIDTTMNDLSHIVLKIQMYDRFITDIFRSCEKPDLNEIEKTKLESSMSKFIESKDSLIKLKNTLEEKIEEKYSEYRIHIATEFLGIEKSEYLQNELMYKDLIDTISFGYDNKLLYMPIDENTFNSLYAEHSKLNYIAHQIKSNSAQNIT